MTESAKWVLRTRGCAALQRGLSVRLLQQNSVCTVNVCRVPWSCGGTNRTNQASSDRQAGRHTTGAARTHVARGISAQESTALFCLCISGGVCLTRLSWTAHPGPWSSVTGTIASYCRTFYNTLLKWYWVAYYHSIQNSSMDVDTGNT